MLSESRFLCEAIWFLALAAADYLPCPDNFLDVIVTSSFCCSTRWQISEVVQPAVQPIAQSLNSGSGSMAKFLAMLGQIFGPSRHGLFHG